MGRSSALTRRPGTRYVIPRPIRRYMEGSAAAGLSRLGSRMGFGSSTATSSSRTSTEMAPLTDQRDIRTTYRKRKMPRRKKRKYIRSIKRFQSQQLRGLPSRISQYTFADDISWAQNTSQYFGCFAGLTGNSAYANNFGNVFEQITNTTAAEDKAQAGGIRIDHMGLRIVLRNLTTSAIQDVSTTVDVDVYKVVCIKDIPLSEWPAALYVESFLATNKNKLRRHVGMDLEVSTTGTGIATQQQNAGTASNNQVVGDCLWNNPQALRYWKVLKQFKIQLPSGGQTEFMWRSSRNKYLHRSDCFGNSALAAKKGLTFGYIFNVNGRAYRDTGVPPTIQFNSGRIMMEAYTRYNVKVKNAISSDTLVHTETKTAS